MSTASASGGIEQEIAQLVVDIGQNLTSTYVNMSAIAFLLYDVLINLDREVEYVWKARWSISKVLFIFGRYYGLCYLIATFVVSVTIGLSLEFCRAWWWYLIMAGDIFFTSLVNMILILRLYAMYRDRRVLAFFIALFICEFAFELYASLTMTIESYNTTFTMPPGIPLPGCFANPNVKIALYAWVPCMVIATAFFGMTVAKVMSRGYTTPKRLRDIKRISPLIVLMVRDGAVYYSLMFAILLAAILIMERFPGFMASAPLAWLVAIYSLAASRLVLNLREAGSRNYFSLFDSDSATTNTGPLFAMNPVKRPDRETTGVSYDA